MPVLGFLPQKQQQQTLGMTILPVINLQIPSPTPSFWLQCLFIFYFFTFYEIISQKSCQGWDVERGGGQIVWGQTTFKRKLKNSDVTSLRRFDALNASRVTKTLL